MISTIGFIYKEIFSAERNEEVVSEKRQEENRKEMAEIEISSSEEALKAPYYNRMDVVVVVDYGDIKGDCLLRKRRPAIVLSRTDYNEHSPIMQVAPMTKSRKGLNKKYHVLINKRYCNNLRGSGMCMLEQTRPIDRRQVAYKIAATSAP